MWERLTHFTHNEKKKKVILRHEVGIFFFPIFIDLLRGIGLCTGTLLSVIIRSLFC